MNMTDQAALQSKAKTDTGNATPADTEDRTATLGDQIDRCTQSIFSRKKMALVSPTSPALEQGTRQFRYDIVTKAASSQRCGRKSEEPP